MTELINSLKTFAYSGSMAYDRRHSSGQLRIIPLLNLGGGKSEADTGFSQWRDAMRMVARLPGGLPVEFRLKLWENLSEKYLKESGIRWSSVLAKSATPTPRDYEIADQIHKDLHRTGCTGFSSSAKQAKLKRVLVSYGRWNPSVGYCQGFNMIGAMLLEMTLGDETLTLKVLIFLIEGVLPQGYFSGGLRGLAVDMAVFREILRVRKPTLHSHLVRLQGGEEQPPLIDVFTMHWFLTLFIHCLPNSSVLRIWDLVLLEGSEVLLRTALVLWAAIEGKILEVRSADEFYSVMGSVTRELLETGLMDANSLVKCVVSVDPFPFPHLAELRQKHRALVQQDTPYKSFFLAKRELDNLKRHYAAIRHRQKATTIIMKGLQASRIRVPGQRSNSLFIPTATQPSNKTVKSGIQPKPKLRRGSSGSKSSLNSSTPGPTPQSNNNNVKRSVQQNNNANRVSSGGSQRSINGNHAPSLKTSKVSSSSQASAAGKTFRRRRTLSASSVTSSSSSTELCDSDEDNTHSSSSEGVWSDSDNKWVTKPPPKVIKAKGSGDEEGEERTIVRSISGEFDTKSDSLLQLPLDQGQMQKSPSIIDTNDSQHFLAEMRKLGKSDSFYENLSKRICELQFQNLKTLNSCCTVIDPATLALPPFPKSPLMETANSPFPQISHPMKSPKSPCSSRHSLSPRDSLQELQSPSNVKTPVSPKALSRKTSKSSVSSLDGPSFSSIDIPDICIDDRKVTLEGAVEIKEDLHLPEAVTDLPLSFPETASVRAEIELLSPLLTSPTSPQKTGLDLGVNSLVSPKSPRMSPKKGRSKSQSPAGSDEGDLVIDKENIFGGKDAAAFLYGGDRDSSPVDYSSAEFLFPTAKCPGQFYSSDVDLGIDLEMKIDLDFRKISEQSHDELDQAIWRGDGEDSEQPSSSEEERKINDVIRENIAILQRLKLHKAAFADDEDEDCSYEDISEDDDPLVTPSLPVDIVNTNQSQRSKKERLSSVSSNNSSCSTSGFLSSSGRRKSSSQGSGGSRERRGSKGQASLKGGELFNPFPTVRKARLRVTKYGLYN